MKTTTRYLVVIAFIPVSMMASSFVAVHLSPWIGADYFLVIDGVVLLAVSYLIWVLTGLCATSKS
ncbi:hypothetical protein [Bdellovibrio sp. HCB209]|uniref:hypothetical protein n=1 Tax=Bdellovibrio sp. HCB209 TaxID=3394354 RepID=UPI0039B5C894